MSVCLFVSNKRQKGLTDWNQILCGTSHNPKESLWMIKISKISLQLNWNFIKFWKYPIFFIKSANFFLLIYIVYKKKKKMGVLRPESLVNSYALFQLLYFLTLYKRLISVCLNSTWCCLHCFSSTGNILNWNILCLLCNVLEFAGERRGICIHIKFGSNF